MSGAARLDVSSAGVTRALTDFAAQLRGEDLPAAITDILGDLFLDCLRVASIGAEMPWSAWSCDYMATLNRNGSAPASKHREVGHRPAGWGVLPFAMTQCA
jgi:hypothetical protein